MLYWVAKLLTPYYSGFHAFSYITLRAILSVMTALSMALLVGPRMISNLSNYQIGQVVRDDGPRSHLPKAGTPTMGGALKVLLAIGARIRCRAVAVSHGASACAD
jgi:phospho-N-acetylmuramoyl-pentapeptide-transferase